MLKIPTPHLRKLNSIKLKKPNPLQQLAEKSADQILKSKNKIPKVGIVKVK